MRERVLREFVSQVLTEDDGYGGPGDISAMAGPMGIAWGGPSLFKTFIQPFVDVAKSGAYAAKRVGSDTRLLLKVGATAIANSVIPFVQLSYTNAFEQAAERAQAIKNEYAEVLNRVDSKLMGDDAQLFMFLLNPVQFLGAKAINGSPDVALWALKTLSGGKNMSQGSFRSSGDSPRPHTSFSSSEIGSVFDGVTGRPTILESADELLGNEEFKALLSSNPKQAMSDRRVVALLNTSPGIKKMRAAAMQTVDLGIRSAFAGLAKLVKAKTLQDVSGITRKGINVDTSKAGDKAEQLEAQLVTAAKAAAAATLAKQFRLDAARYVKAGVPKGNALVVKFVAASKKAADVAARLQQQVARYNPNDEGPSSQASKPGRDKDQADSQGAGAPTGPDGGVATSGGRGDRQPGPR